MFGKKCKRCEKKLGKDFSYCPYCGFDNKSFFQEEKGMIEEDFEMPQFGLFGSSFGGMFDSIAKNLFSQMEKQFREIDSQLGEERKVENKEKKMNRIPIANGISISISTGTGKQPMIKVRNLGEGNWREENIEKAQVIKQPEITEDEVRKFAQLPRKEAETKIRRLSNKVLYEVDVPGVENIKKVFVTKLENSIEIKAFSKDTAFFKLIPISLPLEKYSLKNGKLILELSPKE